MAATIIGGGYFMLKNHASEEDGGPSAEINSLDPKAAGAQLALKAVSAPPLAEPEAAPSAPVGEGAGRPKNPIYSEKDLYPFLTRMRSAKSPGSWASGLQLLRACVGASYSHAFAGNLENAVNDANYRLRLHAKQLIDQRCTTQPIGQYIDQYAPLADDEYGLKYKAAKQTLGDATQVSTDKLTAALWELARQNKLEEAEPVLRMIRRWDGIRWQGSADDFSTILASAVELATAEPGQENNDIRLLMRCYRYGRCDFQYGKIYDLDAEENRAQYERIAREMATAMTSGDLERLLGVKARSSR